MHICELRHRKVRHVMGGPGLTRASSSLQSQQELGNQGPRNDALGYQICGATVLHCYCITLAFRLIQQHHPSFLSLPGQQALPGGGPLHEAVRGRALLGVEGRRGEHPARAAQEDRARQAPADTHAPAPLHRADPHLMGLQGHFSGRLLPLTASR